MNKFVLVHGIMASLKVEQRVMISHLIDVYLILI